MSLKNAPNFKNSQNMLSKYSRLRKGEELLFWILHKIMEIVCVSANVCQCNIAYSFVLVHLSYLLLHVYPRVVAN